MNNVMIKQVVINQNNLRFSQHCRFIRIDLLLDLDSHNHRVAQYYRHWGCEDSYRVTVVADHKGKNTEILQVNRMIMVRKVV